MSFLGLNLSFSRELDYGNNKIKLLKMLLESKKINKQLVIVVCQSLIGACQIKLLKMLLESKKINKQLVIVVCQSLIGACFFLEIRLRLNFAENPIFSIFVFVETDLV